MSENSGADAVLEGLDPEQRQVATKLVGPVCVLAGAGTGKTRAITHRIAYGVRTGAFDPRSVLAVTFTARAAGELRERLRALGAPGVQARTFHAAALRQLRYFLPREFRRPVPRLLEQKARVVAQAAARLGIEVDRAAVRDLAAEIEWAKVHLWTADDYRDQAGEAGRPSVAGLAPLAVSRLISAYEQALLESDAMDFEDVLLVMAGLMEESPAVAREVRSQYRHFVVDEYQDVSPLQQRLLELWLGERRELCVVGDPAQTIYSFAGATSSYLTGFQDRYPDAAVVELVRDYRSTPQVVSLANSLLRRGKQVGVQLVAQVGAGPPVVFRTFVDDAAEAAAVARQVWELGEAGVAPTDVAILYRTNGQSEPIEHALAQAGVRYQVRGGERFFARREVRQAIALLRGHSRAASSEPPMEAVRALLGSLGWNETPPAERGAVRERWESLDALAALAQELLSSEVSSLPELVELIQQRAETDHAPATPGVTLASLHAAKGLEWEAVFLIGLSDGLMPISLAQSNADVAEERRLLYVGVTRAKRHLQLSYARSRVQGGGAGRRVSRFLTGIWPTAEQVVKQARGLAVPDLADLTDQDRALVAALADWRKAEAARRGVPAYAVLTDVTLRAIAARRPATPAELVAVPGIGDVKLHDYGLAVLGIVAGVRPCPGSC